MISHVDFFCSFYFITDWTDLYYRRMNQQQVFFPSNETFLIDCYCNIIVTFGFQSENVWTKRCFSFAQNCNLRSRSGGGGEGGGKCRIMKVR